MTHQTENLCQLRSLGTSNQSQRSKAALFLVCNGNGIWDFKGSILKALLLNLSIWGGPWSPLTGLPLSLRGKPCCTVQLTSCNVESLQGILRPSHYSLALLDTNSNVSRHHPLAFPQVLGISKQPLHIGTSMRAALN